MGIVAISRRRADAGLHRANRDNPTYTFNYRATAQVGTGDAGQGLYGGGGTSTTSSGANTPGEAPCSAPAAHLGKARGRKSLQSLRSGVTPVRWTVNGLRDGHITTSEGDREIAPPWSIVAPEGTGRSPIPEVLSYIMGDR